MGLALAFTIIQFLVVEIYFFITHEFYIATFFFQFIQTITMVTQAVILFRQSEIMSRQLDLYRYHEIPAIVLRYSNTNASESSDSTAIINVMNLTDNPAFYIKLGEILAKSDKRIGNEIIENIRCNIVEYLGSREEREMCHVVNSYKFAEVVGTIKISYWDVYGDRHEMVCEVDEKDKLIFTCMPQNVFNENTKRTK